MRTVTFSDAAVARSLNEKFICTWVNREPGFHNCDLTAERMISEYEAFATKNFCTFFTTPDLDVLHYASGYFSPRLFLEEVKFVHELRKSVLDLKNRYLFDAQPEFAAAHERHARAHADAEPLAVPEKTKEIGRVAKDNSEEHTIQGLRHLSAVHHDLAIKGEFRDGPIPLDAVFKDYLFGNPFQESGQGGKKSPGMKESSSK